MQSFLLKTISFILIINVKFSRSCYSTICLASCYWHNKGFDFGYCKNGLCECAPPIVYVFDGVGRDLSDSAIQNSLGNNNVIQRTISNNKLQKPADTLDEITETTITETKINTENRRQRLQRLQQRPVPENIQKISDASKINLNININNNDKLKVEKGKNNQNIKKPIIQVDQNPGGDSTDSSDYELKRTAKKTVKQDEEEDTKSETVVEYSEEIVTVEDSSESSEEEN